MNYIFKKNVCFRGTVQKFRPEAAGGFTLIEMIVAVGIFAVAAVVSVGALLSIVSANRQAQAVKTVMNNVNFAVEHMSRRIRIGSNYHCDPINSLELNCSAGADDISFSWPKSDGGAATVRYRLLDSSIVKSEDGGQEVAITAPEIEITRLQFFVEGADPADGGHPRVLMLIGGSVARPAMDFNIETMISERLPEKGV